MNANRRLHRGGGQVFGAALLIILGAIFLLVENDVLTGFDFWRLWPLILVVGGTLKLFQRSSDARRGGFVLVTLGILFECSEFGLLPPLSRLWPIIMVVVGIMLLWRALSPRKERDQSGTPMDSFTIFGGLERRISDLDFRGIDMTAIFGGYKVDLRKSLVPSGQAKINVTAIFGGIEMQVPESWNVVIQGVPIFGGFSDETVHPDPSLGSPQLVVDGIAMCGGVVIKN